MNRKLGFTLLELVMIIVVSAIIFTGISIPLRTMLVQGVAPEYQTIASMLGERELERVVGYRFSALAIGVSGPAAFPSPYSNYSYTIQADYVNGPNNLDSVSGPATGYKRIRIRVTHPSITDGVVISTLLTQNDY